MKKINSLSLFFPAYNDAQSIPILIQKANTVAQKIAKKYEIIVINDGSKDSTEKVVKKLQKTYLHLRLINHSKNKGYGEALKSGFTNAQHEWVFYTDGDGQYDPNELLSLVKYVANNIDVVNGYKLTRKDNITRKILGSLYARGLHLLYRLPIRDIDCDFRLIRKELLKNIQLSSSSGLICLELIIKLQKSGSRFAEVGVHHYERQFGSSQFFHPKHLFSTLKEHMQFYISQKTRDLF